MAGRMASQLSQSLWTRRRKIIFFKLTHSATASLALKTEQQPTSKQLIQSQENGWHITALCKEARLNETLCGLLVMDMQHIAPNAYTYAYVLQKCIDTEAIAEGRRLHAHMLQSGFDPDVYLTTKLVVMYVKSSFLLDARQLFDKMPERNSVSWSALVIGYAQHGQGHEALVFFNEMRRAGMRQDEYSFSSVLKGCAGLGLLEEGKQVHQCMIKSGHESNVVIGSALVDTYVKCGSIEDARTVFDKMSQRDVVLWTSIIAGHAQNERANDCLELFKQMLCTNVKPNHFTFGGVLMACSSLEGLEQGKQIHGWLVKSGLLVNVVLDNVLIDMYCKCDSVEDACQVFAEMPQRSKVSWNALIAGYAQQGHEKEALTLFSQMQETNMKADDFTFTSLLRACAGLANKREGKKFHAALIKNGFESQEVLGCALIDMYAKCGIIEDARFIFDEICNHNMVAGNTMITAYAQSDLGEAALEVFHKMQQAGMRSDLFTIASLLQACAGVADLDLGRQIHSQIVKTGLELDIAFENSLIDMYAKSGSIEDAHQVFEEMPERSSVSWTSIILGYGKHGLGKEAVQLFERMRQTDMKLDHVTFLAVLFACSHAGLVDEGWQYFHSMSREHCISPRAEHYGCMIDLLGRAGLLDEAYDFIMNIPIEPNAAMWGALLGACINHVNTKLGKLVAERLFELDPLKAGNYVALSNIYAAAGEWEEVAEVRKLMKDRGVVKDQGRSWIVINKKLHEFCVKRHIVPTNGRYLCTMNQFGCRDR